MVATERISTRIGVLDIFGFECFDKNSLEQLFINFANEKLHNEFMKTIFTTEQEQYKKEGVPVDSIPFVDNSPCLEYLETKTGSIMTALQEQCQVRGGSDERFADFVHQQLNRSKAYMRPNPKFGKSAFAVKHYAGDVCYDSTDFVLKNKDAIHKDLQDVMDRCDSVTLQLIFAKPTDVDATALAKGGKSVHTISSEFSKQLGQLVKTLASAQQHYVRCIKPNPEKVPSKFVDDMMAQQLGYCGVLALTLIRKAGYTVRMDFKTFASKFKEKSPAFAALTASIQGGVRSVEAELEQAKRNLKKLDAARGEVEALRKQLEHAIRRTEKAEEALAIMGRS